MNVPNETLDGWRVLVDEVRGQLNALKFKTRPHTPAWDHVTKADDAARRLGLALEQGGAQRPQGHAPAPDTPLGLLDTPANRRYLQKLREAWEAGLAVDRERYSASIGTDGEAQAVGMILRVVEQEVYGPAGVVRE